MKALYAQNTGYRNTLNGYRQCGGNGARTLLGTAWSNSRCMGIGSSQTLAPSEDTFIPTAISASPWDTKATADGYPPAAIADLLKAPNGNEGKSRIAVVGLRRHSCFGDANEHPRLPKYRRWGLGLRYNLSITVVSIRTRLVLRLTSSQWKMNIRMNTALPYAAYQRVRAEARSTLSLLNTQINCCTLRIAL